MLCLLSLEFILFSTAGTNTENAENFQASIDMAYDLQIGAATLYMEASGEPEESRRAVAHVMVNRWKSGKYGRTLAEICLRDRQFSGWNNKDPNRIRLARAQDSDVKPYEKYLIDAIEGKTKDPTGGALLYFNPKLASPSWDFSKLKKLAQIGSHVFFTEM